MLIHHFTVMGTSLLGPDSCKPSVTFFFLNIELSMFLKAALRQEFIRLSPASQVFPWGSAICWFCIGCEKVEQILVEYVFAYL